MIVTKEEFVELARNSCGVCVFVRTTDEKNDWGSWIRIDGNLFADAVLDYPENYIKELVIDEPEVEGGTIWLRPGHLEYND